jgi:hypothetical protein
VDFVREFIEMAETTAAVPNATETRDQQRVTATGIWPSK